MIFVCRVGLRIGVNLRTLLTSPPRNSISITGTYQDKAWISTGLARAACARPSRDGCRFYPGRRCPGDRANAPDRLLPLHSGQPCTRLLPSPDGGHLDEALPAVHSRSPSGLPLTRHAWMEQARLRLCLELRTPPLPAAHVKVGTGPEHCPGYVTDNTADLQPTRHLPHATSCRTIYEMPFVAGPIVPYRSPILLPRRAFILYDPRS